MVTKIENNGIVSKEHLLITGCTEEIGRQGRRAYINNSVFVAMECSSCREIKYTQYFRKKTGQRGNVVSQCKKCETKYQLKWQNENIELAKERRIKRIRENPEKYKRVNNGQRGVEDKEKRRARVREDYRNNPERTKRNNQKYYHLNKEKKRLIDQRRRARKRLLPDTLSSYQLNKINGYFNGMCALTGETSSLHLDHVIPLSTGHGGTTYENMIPLSANLNTSKHDSNIFEWFDANCGRFNLERKKFDNLIKYLSQVNEMTTSEYRKYVDWCFDNPQ